MRLLLAGLTWRRSSLALGDHLLIVGAVILAVYIRGGSAWDHFGWPLLWLASLIAVIVQICLHYCDLYDVRTLRDPRGSVIGLLQALGASAVILALLYYWLPQLILGRGVFLLSAVGIALAVGTWRALFVWFSAQVGPAQRLLILGTNSAAFELARELEERRHLHGVELIGFIDPDRPAGAPSPNPAVLGGLGDVPRLVRELNVDRVVVSLGESRGKLPMDQLLEMKLSGGVRFDHLASVYEEFTGKIAIQNLRPSWLIFSEGFRKTPRMLAAKRTFDVAISLVALLVLAPVMLLVAIAIKLTSPGGVLYHQQRVGLNGRVFTVHKFRSMRQDAEVGTGAVWSTAGDPRVTPVGRFLRRTRLDELPQFWNILRGEMSLVGPRPERPEFVSKLTEQIAFYGQRHVVAPGLTGWAQVRHSYGSTVDDALQKLQFDLYYIKHMSVAFDVYILIETAKTVLVRPGS